MAAIVTWLSLLIDGLTILDAKEVCENNCGITECYRSVPVMVTLLSLTEIIQ